MAIITEQQAVATITLLLFLATDKRLYMPWMSQTHIRFKTRS